MVKRLFFLILVFIFIFAAAACGNSNKDAGAASTNADTTGTSTVQTTATSEHQNQGETSTEESSYSSTALTGDTLNTEPPENAQLLQSASVDLDGDNINEQIEALQVKTEGASEGDPGELEGILKITDGDNTLKIPFIKKTGWF